jgi:hypothetical protein
MGATGLVVRVVDTGLSARQQSVPMRHLFFFLLLLFWAACGYAQSTSYLFVWAGDDAKKSSVLRLRLRARRQVNKGNEK